MNTQKVKSRKRGRITKAQKWDKLWNWITKAKTHVTNG